MLFNRFYYELKPVVPFPVRIGLRRLLARRKRREHAATWPIDPASAGAPKHWAGWPDGKSFALVITHDVEGSRGLQRCRQLMDLEAKFGLRSSFNFVPEGSYDATLALRDYLASQGCEIGVHDLHHNGKLYQSRKSFNEKAVRINHYIKEWGAAGFRSGFMHHNLDWMHELDVAYDSSTFDTDPFEPQPDGVHTIFPFWVPNPSVSLNPNPNLNLNPNGPRHSSLATLNGSDPRFNDSTIQRFNDTPRTGYVELPYTLPQDFTLFIVLREQSTSIWEAKLDWIAAHGGMALINVHPDYMNFGDGRRTAAEYDVVGYENFLRHIVQRYKGAYWQALPREVAEFWKKDHQSHTTEKSAVCHSLCAST